MLTGTDKLELEKKFKAGLAAVFNKIASIKGVNVDFEPLLRAKLMVTADEATLQYGYLDNLDVILKQHAQEIAAITKQAPEELAKKFTDRGYEYFSMPSELLDSYFDHKKNSSASFPIQKHFHDIEHEPVIDFSVSLQAKNLQGLVDGMNEMLTDFGLLERYKIELPPERGQSGGRGGAKS